MRLRAMKVYWEATQQRDFTDSDIHAQRKNTQSIINSKLLVEEYDLLSSLQQSMERCLKLQRGLSPTSAKEIKSHGFAQRFKNSAP